MPPKPSKPPRQSNLENEINKGKNYDNLRRLSQTDIGLGDLKVNGGKPSVSDHRSGFAIKYNHSDKDEVTLYPNRVSPRDNEEPAPLIVETLPPEVEEDFQIPMHSSKRHSEFKLSSSNRYRILAKTV